jgi:hypothetical protein
MKPYVTQAVFEDSGLVLMGRGRSPGGAYFQQADFDSIKLKIYDAAAPATLIVPEITLTISDVIFNSLQTSDSNRWTIDTTGYNFRHVVRAAHLPTGGREARLEYKFTPAGVTYDPFHAVIRIPVMGLYGS